MAAARTLPEVTAANEHFWRGGRDGALVLLRCRACALWVHPPAPVCPRCLGDGLATEATSGRGTVVACTINCKAWAVGDSVPYVIAVVELVEQPGLRLMTNIVGCAPEAVVVGTPVRVRFEHEEDVWIPLFEPAEAKEPR